MKLKKVVLILLSIFILLASLTTLFYSFYIVEDKLVVPMDVEVGENIGFNLDTDAMHFGTIVSPGSAWRGLIVSHKSEYPLKIDIKTYGEMDDWVYVEENGFILEPSVNKQVNLTVVVPKGVEHGYYYGTIVILFKRISLFG